MLERAHRRHDDDGRGPQARLAALDIEELLRAQVRAEAGLGHAVVAQLHRHARRHDGVAAVGDVRKRAAVDERRGALQRLHEVRLERVLEQRGHGARRLQVARGHGLVVVGVAHDDLCQAFLEVADGGGEAEHGHDLAGDGDVKAVLARHALHPAAQAVDDIAQLAVVHVHAALPGDLLDVDAQPVALLDVVVQHRGQQVVRRADGVEVAGEVQVDVLHRHNLRVAAAGRAALHAEHRAEARLAQREDRVLADAAHAVGQAHARGGLALARRGRGDGGDQHQLAVGRVVLIQKIVIHLRLVVAVKLQVLFGNARSLRDLADVLHFTRLRDFDIGQISHDRILLMSSPAASFHIKRRTEQFSAPRRSAQALARRGTSCGSSHFRQSCRFPRGRILPDRIRKIIP